MGPTLVSDSRTAATPARALFLALIVALTFAGVSGFHLGAAPISTRAELRVHQVARTMQASGDWIIPRYQGELRLNKPPLMYWAVAGANTLGASRGTRTLRVIPWASAVLLVIAVMVWSMRVLGPAHAPWVGLVLGCLWAMQSEARTGTAEMLLALLCFITLALAERMIHRTGRLALTTWGLVFALALATKATMPLLVVGLPPGLHLLGRRELSRLGRPAVLATIGGALVVGLSWFVVVGLSQPGALDQFLNALMRPIGVDAGTPPALGASSHYDPWYGQLRYLVKSAFPFTLLLPVIVWRGIATRGWADSPSLRLAATIVVSLLIALCLLPQKRSHYLLPLLPWLAVLTVDAVTALRTSRPRVVSRVAAYSAAVLVPLALLLTGALVFWQRAVLGGSVTGSVAIALVGVVLAGALVVTAAKGQLKPFALCCVALWAGLLLARHGSVDVWERSFKTGIADRRGDFDAARWASVRERYEVIADWGDEDEDWVARVAGDADAVGSLATDPFLPGRANHE